jgi:voltage-gated potassium channel
MLGVSVAFLLVLLVPLVFTRLSDPVRNVLTLLETVLWVVFVVDYLIRLILTQRRWRFFWTHIPELIVITVPVLRPLRSLQAIRLLRLGGLGTVANQLARRSLQARSVLWVTAVTVILVLTVAGVVLIIERGNPQATISSYPEALWWALSTVTTVGYGDVYPVTNGGRLAALLLMLCGIALVGIITASVAAWFVRSVVRSAEPVTPSADNGVLNRLDVLESRMERIDDGIRRILHLLDSEDTGDNAHPGRSAVDPERIPSREWRQ